MTQRQFTTDIDISSVDFWRQNFVERDRAFEVLRKRHPVSWHPPLETPELRPEVHGEAGFWAIVNGEDVSFVSKNYEIFSSDEARFGSLSIMLRPHHPSISEPPTFLGMDPPKHTQFRRVLSAAFTPKAVAHINAKIEERTRSIIDRVSGAGEIDFVTEVSSRLPMLTIADLIGVPDEKVEEFAQVGDRALRFYDPQVNDGADPMQFRADQLLILREMGAELIERRRVEPKDDVATALANASTSGIKFDGEDVQQIMLLLSVAGNDTTKQTTSHMVVELWRNPDQRAWLMEDFDERIAMAVDEFARHASPVINFTRTATRDIELHGETIHQGDKVAIFFSSANRDEKVFDDPHRFDLSRHPNDHWAFGRGGVHFCLGHAVAKAQLRSLSREILHKLPHMEVGQPDYLVSDFIHGIERLPVRIPATYS